MDRFKKDYRVEIWNLKGLKKKICGGCLLIDGYLIDENFKYSLKCLLPYVKNILYLKRFI